MMRNQSYNEKVDVWSFGMILYELTTNTIPFKYCRNAFLVYEEVTLNKKTPPIPEGIEIDSTLHDLMKQCWNWDPQQRPSFSEIVQTLKKSLSQKQ
jgi:serine/threonine protein kinase